nr:hypothetical protein [Metamycoplasma hominis]
MFPIKNKDGRIVAFSEEVFIIMLNQNI